MPERLLLPPRGVRTWSLFPGVICYLSYGNPSEAKYGTALILAPECMDPEDGKVR